MWERKSFVYPTTPRQQSITEGIQGWDWRQGLKQRHGGTLLTCFPWFTQLPFFYSSDPDIQRWYCPQCDGASYIMNPMRENIVSSYHLQGPF